MPSPAAAAAAVATAAGVGAVGDPCTFVVVADQHSPTAEPRSQTCFYMSKLRYILTCSAVDVVVADHHSPPAELRSQFRSVLTF